VFLAELPWYDLPELVPATDLWWLGIASHMRAAGLPAVPDRLEREGSYLERWRQPELLLSQACGYDVLYDHADELEPIATPCYAAEGCEGPRYRSLVLVRADRPFRTLTELRGGRVAINQASSHSGTNALRPLIAPLARDGKFFGAVVETGSHTDSLAALQDATVDVACIDTVVLALLRRVRPAALRGLRRIACSAPALAPPYVMSRQAPPERRDALRRALRAAVTDPGLAAVRHALLLRDFLFLPATCYAELATFEEPAADAGWFELPAPATSPLQQRQTAPRA
jgi:ABC-type phosphate/phosphonate transport system substrate-binding protein